MPRHYTVWTGAADGATLRFVERGKTVEPHAAVRPERTIDANRPSPELMVESLSQIRAASIRHSQAAAGPAGYGTTVAAAARVFAQALLVAALLVGWPSSLAAEPSPTPSTPGTLFGDAGGVRTFLGQYGVSLGLQNISELLGNPNGGRAQGVTFDGQSELSLAIDLDKAFGLKGGIFNVSAFQNYGHGVSNANIDNLNLVSSVEALRSAWLYELWYQQSFGIIDVRLGQLGADQEFIISQYANWFVNAAFGWPTLPTVDLPAGGPSVPLATPGIRVRLTPGPFTLLAAVFNGDPAGSGVGNPQRRDASGAVFHLKNGVFVIGEMQYAIKPGKNAQAPSVTLKIGGWYTNNSHPNEFFANDGLTVTSSSSSISLSGISHENWSLYGVVDAMLLPAGKGGLAGFVRASVAPPARSAVSQELAGGLVYMAPFGRDSDQAGFAVSSVKVGQPISVNGAATRFTYHGRETVLELSYQAQALPWLQIQPDAQYVITPGGSIPNPNASMRKVGSAAVFGVRVTAAL